MQLVIPKRNLITLLIGIFLGCFAYSNSLHVPFLFDDERNIKSPELRISDLSAESISNALTGGELKERPISNFSFALNYYVHGYELPGYHLVNITLHILTAFVLYLLIKATISMPVNEAKYRDQWWIAELTAIIWLVHPMATQSVTYIVQRMTLMAAFFYVLSLYLYILFRKEQMSSVGRRFDPKQLLLIVSSVIGAVFAVGSKEIAATLPIFIFLYEWFFFQGLSAKWLKGKLYWIFATIVVFAVIAFVFLDGNPVNYIVHGCDWRDFTVIERIMTQPRVVWHYMGLLLVPFPGFLVFDYNFPVSESLFSPITGVFSLLGLIILLSFALYIARKEHLIAFCILWFLGNLVIESSVICLEMVFEHRTYLPSMFFVLFLICVLARFLPRAVCIGLLVVSTGLFSHWTHERNEVWKDNVTFWQDSVTKQPGKARSHNNLGTAYYLEGNLEKAEEQLLLAIKCDPAYSVAFNNIGLVKQQNKLLDEAEIYFNKAIDLTPNYVDAMLSLANVYVEKEDYQSAGKLLYKAVRKAPAYYKANIDLAKYLFKIGDFKGSIKYLSDSLAIKPDRWVDMKMLGDAYLYSGNPAEASRVYKNVIELGYDDALTYYNLAMASNSLGELNEAKKYFEIAVEKAPYFLAAYYNLGNVNLRLGETAKAEQNYNQLAENVHLISNALNNMGMIKLKEGNLHEAEAYFKRSISVMPGNRTAQLNLDKLQQSESF